MNRFLLLLINNEERLARRLKGVQNEALSIHDAAQVNLERLQAAMGALAERIGNTEQIIAAAAKLKE